ncbi:hypothetical protein [Achromobacter sp. Root565]|uniref:hypothetical protein n=1 Tax=Achromobacter sp. Root565 TaxID=1736564 RepID=UPI000ACDEABA|nr:hypothetical protein [Achromobacter sp. Root565]
MQIGSELLIPEGFAGLVSTVSYHFLRSSTLDDRVWLAFFRKQGKEWCGELVSLPKSEFERGLLTGKVSAKKGGHTLPPGLWGSEGLNLLQIDEDRSDKKRSNLERAHRRLLHIQPLLRPEMLIKIFSASSPHLVINAHAVAIGQTQRRVRFWFLAYLCFGQTVYALFPNYQQIGRWDRLSKSGDIPYGRRSLTAGLHDRIRVDKETRARIAYSYQALRSPGKALAEIYREAATRYFGCTAVERPDGSKIFVPKPGIPFPSLDQYTRCVKKHVGEEALNVQRYGNNRARRVYQPSRGKFSQPLRNFMEVVEADAYHCVDRPRSYFGQKVLDSVCVVRGICGTTGYVCGIGFSFGAERSSAYNAMLFSMAIGKKIFCSLFGIDIDDDTWPGCGLPGGIIVDRGPGAAALSLEPLNKEQGEHIPWAFSELTPSGAGQSKATVESSHPRSLSSEEPNQIVHGELDPVHMAVREIRRAIADNEASSADDRITPEMIRDQVRPTPRAMAKFLIGRARTDAKQVRFEDAVRAYLQKVDVKVNRDGLNYNELRYDSPALRESGVFGRTAGSPPLLGYVLPFCMRYMWVETPRGLVEVDGTLPIQDDPGQLYLSQVDLFEFKRLKKEGRRIQKINASAVIAEQHTEYERQTGKRWSDGIIKKGRRKVGERASREESSQMKAILEGKSRGHR